MNIVVNLYIIGKKNYVMFKCIQFEIDFICEIFIKINVIIIVNIVGKLNNFIVLVKYMS